MKVIYSIGARFAGGGIGTVAYHAVRGLHQHGMLHRLLVGSYRPTEIPRERIRSLGLASRVLRKLAVYDRTNWLRHLHSLLYDRWAAHHLEPANLFHVWGNHGWVSLRRAKALGMETVVERASSHPLFQADLLREEYARWGLTFPIPQAVLRRAMAEMEVADYVIIPSDFVHQTFLEHGFPESKLLQVPFGTDTSRFRPTDGREPHPFRILFVGQVGIRKGAPYLLEAWQQLGWRDAELWLLGRVSSEMKAILPSHQDVPGVRLVGYTPDLVAAYQSADVFAFPTIEEGSALVTYEALACGLPVITTPNAGSVVRDGVEGFLLPIRDVDALATALEQLRADERLRREMGWAARARAEEFTWEKYGDRLAQTYEAAGSRG